MTSYQDLEIVKMWADALRRGQAVLDADPSFDKAFQLSMHSRGSTLAAQLEEQDIHTVTPLGELTIRNGAVNGFQGVCGNLHNILVQYEEDMHVLRELAFYESPLRIILNEECGEGRVERWKPRLLKRYNNVKDILSEEAVRLTHEENWGALEKLISETRSSLRKGTLLKITGTNSLHSFYRNDGGVSALFFTPRPFYASQVYEHAVFRKELQDAARYDKDVFFQEHTPIA